MYAHANQTNRTKRREAEMTGEKTEMKEKCEHENVIDFSLVAAAHTRCVNAERRTRTVIKSKRETSIRRRGTCFHEISKR